MNITEVVICEICKKRDGIYSCPRCSRKYCSSSCYKSKEHELCSESFYKEWVESSLHEKAFDTAEKDKMIGILKKFHSDVTEDAKDELSIVERFAGLNIDNASEDLLWQNLSEKEQAEFIELIKDDKNLETLVRLKQPWWTVTSVRLVTDLDEVEKLEDVSFCPGPPSHVKKLSQITKKKPSECIKYNLVNMLYAYAFLNRFYNCELRDFLEDVVKGIFQFSPVLSEGKNYSSLEESVQDSIRLIINSDLNIQLNFAKSIVNDVCSILQGPQNTVPTYFVMCALNDIELIFFELRHELSTKENVDRSLKKQLMPAIAKMEYYLSWCLDFSDVFSELASDLFLFMIPDLLVEPLSLKSEETTKDVRKTPIIEEIE